MVVTVTMGGYIKRTPLAVFREQKRGGKGRAGMATKEEDAVTNLFVTSTHNPVLFFSNLGRVYRMKVWRLPEGGPNTKGRPMVNLLPLARGRDHLDRPAAARGRGRMGRPPHHVRDRARHGPPQQHGGIHQHPDRRQDRDALRDRPAEEAESDDNDEQADPTDRLIGVELLTEGDDVLLATRNGKAIRFMATDVREFQSRTSTGVRGVRLADRRRGDLDVDPASRRHQPGGARGLSPLRAVEGREGRRMLAPRRAHRRACTRRSSSS